MSYNKLQGNCPFQCWIFDWKPFGDETAKDQHAESGTFLLLPKLKYRFVKFHLLIYFSLKKVSKILTWKKKRMKKTKSIGNDEKNDGKK